MSERDEGDPDVQVWSSDGPPDPPGPFAPSTTRDTLGLVRLAATVVAAVALVFMAIALRQSAQADRRASCVNVAQVAFFAEQSLSRSLPDDEQATDGAADRDGELPSEAGERRYRERLRECGVDFD